MHNSLSLIFHSLKIPTYITDLLKSETICLSTNLYCLHHNMLSCESDNFHATCIALLNKGVTLDNSIEPFKRYCYLHTLLRKFLHLN